jgi:hypothetical protein
MLILFSSMLPSMTRPAMPLVSCFCARLAIPSALVTSIHTGQLFATLGQSLAHWTFGATPGML